VGGRALTYRSPHSRRGCLSARGTDGADIDRQLAEVQGSVLIRSGGLPGLLPPVDVLLRLGKAIDLRSSDAKAITEALSDAGVPVTTA
jgi:hypothetical protein